MATGIAPRMLMRPQLRDMIVSASRPKNSIDDDAFTCQMLLADVDFQACHYRDLPCTPATYKEVAFANLVPMLEAGLCVSLTDMSIV
jgi:hypothetical protein